MITFHNAIVSESHLIGEYFSEKSTSPKPKSYGVFEGSFQLLIPNALIAKCSW